MASCMHKHACVHSFFVIAEQIHIVDSIILKFLSIMDYMHIPGHRKNLHLTLLFNKNRVPQLTVGLRSYVCKDKPKNGTTVT